MAKRLPIVMIQSHPPHSSAEQLSDDIVGELIGSTGMDLMLVAPLASLSIDAIDRLTLESLQGDAVIMDWNSVETVMQSWRDLGLSGVRARHELDTRGDAGEAGQPCLYIIDLNVVTSCEQLMSVLEQIQAAGQVKTFTLGLTVDSGSSAGEPRARTGRVSTSEGVADARMGSSGRNGEDTKLVPIEAPISEVVTTKKCQGSQSSNSKNKLDLDALMDELDRADP